MSHPKKLTPVEFLLSWFCLLTFSGIILGHENGPNGVTVTEGSDVILPCSLKTKENITSNVFHWSKDGRQDVFVYDAGQHYNNGLEGQHEQFKARVSHFPGELKTGNASIMIRNTKTEDSGVYTCGLLSKTFPIKLVVVDHALKDRSGEIRDAATKPNLTSLHETKNGVLLQCEVRDASKKPKLHWEDKDGNNLTAEEPKETERGGRYDLILNITVTKTGNYRCVATQKEISHQIYSEIVVFIPESSHGAGLFVGGWFSGVLSLVLVLGLFEVSKRIKRHKKGSPQGNGSISNPSEEPLKQSV